MSEKIQPSHIEREAYVYIRQSSMQQVRTRLEGQRRQYDLRERALARDDVGGTDHRRRRARREHGGARHGAARSVRRSSDEHAAHRDPLRIVGDGLVRLSPSRRPPCARWLRLRGPARGTSRDPRLHVLQREVSGPRAGRARAAALLPRGRARSRGPRGP